MAAILRYTDHSSGCVCTESHSFRTSASRTAAQILLLCKVTNKCVLFCAQHVFFVNSSLKYHTQNPSPALVKTALMMVYSEKRMLLPELKPFYNRSLV